MFGTLTTEKEVQVPPSEAWKLYGTLQLGRFLVEAAIPGLINKFTVIEGDGGAGTVLELFFPSGNGGETMSYKEKFTVVDDEKRVKVAEVVEGGYLDLGFTLYRVRFEVIEKEGKENECITKATIEYELKEEAAANAALVSVQPLLLLLEFGADNLHKNYNN